MYSVPTERIQKYWRHSPATPWYLMNGTGGSYRIKYSPGKLQLFWEVFCSETFGFTYGRFSFSTLDYNVHCTWPHLNSCRFLGCGFMVTQL